MDGTAKRPIEARVALAKHLLPIVEEHGWSGEEIRLALDKHADDIIVLCAADPENTGEVVHYMITPGETEWQHHLGDGAGCEVFTSAPGMALSLEQGIEALKHIRTHRESRYES